MPKTILQEGFKISNCSTDFIKEGIFQRKKYMMVYCEDDMVNAMTRTNLCIMISERLREEIRFYVDIFIMRFEVVILRTNAFLIQ